MKKKDSLDRIADALEWRNYFDWYWSNNVAALDEGTGPPPPPPPPPQNDEPIGGG